MELPKLGIINIYLFKSKWSEMNTKKVYSKRECPQKDLLRLEDHEGVRKNMKDILS